MTEEEVLLQEAGVTVTKTRFIIPSQTYAMAGVTSVRALYDDPSRKWPIIAILFGALIMLGGFGSETPIGGLLGVAIIVGGVLWLRALKRTFYIVLHTAGDESRALESKDEAWIDRVVVALNEAIVARG